MAVETSGNIPGFTASANKAPRTGAAKSEQKQQRHLQNTGQRLRNLVEQTLAIIPTHKIFTSLARRIFVANFLGLIILSLGIVYISLHRGWLITAKLESLRIQGEIIASAIAANAKVTRSDGLTLDPSKLPDVENPRVPLRDDSFSAMQLSISPLEVAPILRRLIKPTNTRARIFSRDYILIADSNDMLTLSSMEDDLAKDGAGAATPASRSGARSEPMQSFWTKLSAKLSPGSTPVYREMTNDKISRYPEVRVAMKTGTSMDLIVHNDKGQQIVSLATPIKRLNAVQGVLLLSTKPGQVDEIIATERRLIWRVLALGVFATVIASMVLTYTISNPMRELSAAAQQVTHNINERTRLPRFRRRTDEVGKLAVSFHDMTAALYRRIEESEKFAADVAHELKNPLTAARGTAEALEYAKDDAMRDNLVKQIGLELHRLNRLITDVAYASRLNADLALQESQPVDLRGVLIGVTNTFKDMHGRQTNNLQLDMPDLPSQARDFIVNGHEGRLAQVLTNLLDNAISFSPEQGLVRISLQRQEAEIEIRIEDQGQGIPADKLETIFSRFYSDRPSTEALKGKNSGLGLSISREIIQAYGGEIWAENRGSPLESLTRAQTEGLNNRSGEGAVFIIRLPAAFPDLRLGRSRQGRWS